MKVDPVAAVGAVTRELQQREHEGQTARVVVAARSYDTDIQDLWDALTNPERIPRWFLPVSGDLKLGGRYQFQGNAGGTITACEPPRRVAATWEFGGAVSWVVDGSNLLGGARADVAAKRRLVQALAQFARARRTKVTCTFDGNEPEHFGTHLGSVKIVFSGASPADELIAKQVASGSGWKVVTSDRALAARVKRRTLQVVETSSFLRELESLPRSESTGSAEDWSAYFSDPKNRNIF